MIGLHVNKIDCPHRQRQMARESGLTVFQTMVGSTQSFTIPHDLHRPYKIDETEPAWVWHAPYVVTVKPGRKSEAINSDHLAALINNADKFKIRSIVVHSGATVGLDSEEVVDAIYAYLVEYYLLDLLSCSKATLAVEIGASLSEFNANPHLWAKATQNNERLGWCLDLAHVWAAGVTWSKLAEAIEIKPPYVCHANFPGSERASGQDIHGWRCSPAVVQRGKMMGQRTELETMKLVKDYDEILKLLRAKGVPLVLEGSGFESGSHESELACVRDILQ